MSRSSKDLFLPVLVAQLVFTVPCIRAEQLASSASATDSTDGISELNLPADFVQKIRHRAELDRYAAKFHIVEAEIEPGVVRSLPQYQSNERAIRTVRAETPESVLRYRLAMGNPVRPLRGFRAPILDEMHDLRSVTLAEGGLTPKGLQAAELIRKSLAFDGLLVTLARTLEVLGAERFVTNRVAGIRELWELGFPVDLLAHFRFSSHAPVEPANTIAQVSERLSRGETAEGMKALLQATLFAFSKAHSDFRAAEETGGSEIALLRLQLGGGYRGGIVRGGSIDVTGQLASLLPGADFLVTVPDEHLENIRRLALNSWHLRRANCLILIPEKSHVTSWAQDNGKAGFLAGAGPASGTPATLAPRYASQAEVNSPFFAGDSFLMDGLRAAGHQVLQSPLLFQGGNLLVVRDPSHEERLLLLSETEVYRNVALGLTREQVLEAFRLEFAVERCVVVPAVSYHLDYDITVRAHEGQMIGFVNDTLAAARLIVQSAIAALENGGLISPNAAREATMDLVGDNIPRLLRLVATATQPFLNEHRQYGGSLVRLFATEPTDSPVFNFQCFLAALDVLASHSPPVIEATKDSFTSEYFAALRSLDAAARAQQDQLRKLGWKIIAIPSMPDLYHSLNYLNGLHDRTRFLMPAMGGFYTRLDDAASRAFQAVLGEKLRIVRIFSAECQQKHGGVHCVAAVYPRVEKERAPLRGDGVSPSR